MFKTVYFHLIGKGDGEVEKKFEKFGIKLGLFKSLFQK